MSDNSWTSTLLLPEETALHERFAKITSEHSVRGMFMQSTLECLRRDLGEERGPGAVEAAMKEAGFEGVTWGAMKKVPLSDFNKLRIAVGRALLPVTGCMEVSSARIAASAVEIFFESVAGRTMMLLAGKDPHRLMGAAPNGYSLTVDDGGVRKYDKIDDHTGRFSFAGDLVGPCHEYGVFSSAIKTVCGKSINVVIDQPNLTDFVFTVTW